MSKNNDYERRRQAAFARLGTDHPQCAFCCEPDWRCLELHHIAGQAFGDEDLAIVCRNCHRKLSDTQNGHPRVESRVDPSLLERLGHYMLGLADLFEQLVQRFREYGSQLIDAARACPQPYRQAHMGGAPC
jgi:hypothetical protein